MSKINGQAWKINTGECKIVTIGVFGCMVGRAVCLGRWRDRVFYGGKGKLFSALGYNCVPLCLILHSL